MRAQPCKIRGTPNLTTLRTLRALTTRLNAFYSRSGSPRSSLEERRRPRPCPALGTRSRHKRRPIARGTASPSRARGPLRAESRSTLGEILSRTCGGTLVAATCGARQDPSRWRGRCGTCGVRPVFGTRRSLPPARLGPRTDPRPAPFSSQIALLRRGGTEAVGSDCCPIFGGGATTGACRPVRFSVSSQRPVELHHIRDLSCSLFSAVLLRGSCRNDDGRHRGPRNSFAHDGGDRKQEHAT